MKPCTWSSTFASRRPARTNSSDEHPAASKRWIITLHSRSAYAASSECQEQDTADSIRRDAPGLVKMVEAEEHTICYPAPPAKCAFHLGKQHSAKQQLLSEDRVEGGADHEQCKEPPRADELGQYRWRFEHRIEAIALRLGQKWEDPQPESGCVRR